MTLKEYAKYINDLAEKHPKAMVIYSGDEEGNYYEEVGFVPTVGKYHDGQFDGMDGKGKVAVCIN